MSDPLLEVEALDVYYGKSQALDGVSLTVERGEIGGIVGPNGAGKTTLLDTVAGFLDYDGTIQFNGREAVDLDPQQLVNDGLVYCTEDRDLFPFFSVHENLLMGAQFREDRDATRADLDMVYDLFPRLDDRRDQEAQTMSGGEQQMLAIGRALMGDPELLILDEPTLGLAPVIIDDISDAIETLNDQGQTLLLVEQNATFALRHAHRLSLLESGRVELSGSAAEFQNNDYITEAYVGIH